MLMIAVSHKPEAVIRLELIAQLLSATLKPGVLVCWVRCVYWV